MSKKSHHKDSKEIKESSESSYKLEQRVIENLVTIQKIHTDLAEKFDKLAKEISQLLSLFELAARSFSSHTGRVSDKDKEFLDKIDKLLEQNKTIAKGLTLMEEKIRLNMYSSSRTMPAQESIKTEEYFPENSFQTTGSKRPLPKF